MGSNASKDAKMPRLRTLHRLSSHSVSVSSSVSRKKERISISSDRPQTFKKSLSSATKKLFDRDRRLIWNKTAEYIPDVAKHMASSYKIGNDMFPCHYDYGNQSFVLEEPNVLLTSKKSERKKPAYLEGIFRSIIADERRDRLAVLVIGLANLWSKSTTLGWI